MKYRALVLCLLNPIWLTLHAGGAVREAALQGVARDESGAVVPGVVIELKRGGSVQKSSTGKDGYYHLNGLIPGEYSVRATRAGFSELVQPRVTIAAEQTARLDIDLRIEGRREELTVSAEAEELSVADPASNASALILKGKNLEALPDDPDDLLADLLALAGGSAAAGPPQVLVDGFSGAKLPPKQAIREIRLNQNPFSAEYDRMGLGRIEVATKPGAEQLHGSFSMKAGDAVMNSRNPYAPTRPPYRSRQLDGDVGASISARVSLYANFERGDVTDNAVIQARVLDSSWGIVPFNTGVLNPSHWTTAALRTDVKLSDAQSLTVRYEWFGSAAQNAGVGMFALPSQGRSKDTTTNLLQVTHTTVLSAGAVNELRFQYTADRSGIFGDSSTPTLRVLGAFTGGGLQAGTDRRSENRYEAQNVTSLLKGPHSFRFGWRVRGAALKDYATRNFNGEYIFSGGLAPALDAAGRPTGAVNNISSIERYRRTLYYLSQGFSLPQVIALGGGASQFSVSNGSPAAALNSADLGFFMQDDWRVRPNLTLSAGLRYELQTNVHDWLDLGPRLGVAWAPGGKQSAKALTVIRAGAGVFFDRFGEDFALEARRFDGFTERQYVVNNPTFFPAIPSFANIQAAGVPATVRRIDSHLRAPYYLQSSIGVERRLPYRIVVTSTYLDTRGVHLLRSRNINAPLPGSLDFRPFAGGNIYSYESAGILKQRQWITTINRRFKDQFSLFANYTWNNVLSDTEGANFFPSNQYNTRVDYGRAATDIHHQLHAGGVFTGPFGWTLSPFVTARSGVPFDIVTGLDPYGDSQFNHRPVFAANAAQPGAVATRFGIFNLNAPLSQTPIPRNYGNGPGLMAVNFRLSKTISFGAVPQASDAVGRAGGTSTHNGSAEGRFSLTFAVIARNAFNHVNAGLPTGNLSSPLFGASSWLASVNDPAQAAQGDNRRIQLQVRLRF